MTVPASGAWRRAVPFAAVTLTVLAINIYGTWVPHPWGDEVATWISTQRSMSQLLSMLQSVDAVHGLYYLLLRPWVHLFGYSAVSLRCFSALGVAVCAILVMALSRKLFPKVPVAYAGLICGLVPPLTWAATEARSAAWASAAASAMVLAYWLAAHHDDLWRWILYAVLCVLGVTLFLYLALMPVSLVLVSPLLRRGARIPALAATIAAGLLATPMIWMALRQSGQVNWVSRYRATATDAAVKAFWGDQPVAQAVGTCLLCAAVVCALILWRRTERRLPMATLFAWLVVPSVILLLVSVVKPLYVPRYVTYCAPAAALLVVLVIEQVRVQWMRLLVTAVVIAAMLPSWSAERRPDAKPSAATVVAQLDHVAQPGDSLYIVGRDLGGLRWAFPETFGRLRIVGQADSGWRDRLLYQPSQRPTELEHITSLGRLWIFADRGALGSTLDDFKKLGFREVSRIQGTDTYRTLLVLLARS